MKVLLNGKEVSVTDRNLLGVGGEARVYRHRNHALKIFHPIDKGLPAADRKQQQLLMALKRKKLRAFPRGLPKNVAAPIELVTNKSGHLIGFSMPLINGATDLLRLSQRKWREGLISNQEVTALFRQIYLTLVDLHQHSVIVGDLNHANIVFDANADRRAFFIDADSMQFANFPCPVGHERFLDPLLFGKSLLTSPLFSEESDWYAFSVLLFSSLLYVHPYGGVHADYPTLLRRAEAMQSILRPTVKRPKSAVMAEILPDDLLHWFAAVFDQGKRGIFPAQLLELRWHLCSCGLEHARAVCPACALKGTVNVVQQAVAYHGSCRAQTIFKTKGRIFGARIQGNLKYLYDDSGEVRRENGRLVMQERLLPEHSFGIAGSSTWVGQESLLVRVEGEAVRGRKNTETFAGRPVFATNAAGLYYLDDQWLTEERTGKRLGQVLSGQTWFQVGEKLGFGFYRAGLLSFFFVFRTDRPGLINVSLPQIKGRVVDAEACFDGKNVLFSLATESNGQRTHALYLIDSGGHLIAQRTGSPENDRILQDIGGKTLHQGRILTTSSDGLISLEVDRVSGQLVESFIFADSAPFMAEDLELLPGPNGSVYLVSTKEITQLTLVAPQGAK
jgi:hypothetical protein